MKAAWANCELSPASVQLTGTFPWKEGRKEGRKEMTVGV
jgi:hypothetical protein